MRVFRLRSVVLLSVLLFLMWHAWSGKIDKNERLQRKWKNLIKEKVEQVEESTEDYEDDKDYQYEEQRSSSSFTSTSRSVSSASENVSEDNPKPITAPVLSVNMTSEDIATEVEEFLAENKLRKETIARECRNFISESKTTGGYRRIIAKTVQARRPRAQMFTIDPRRR